jgi:hypothetical protein
MYETVSGNVIMFQSLVEALKLFLVWGDKALS